MQRRHWIALVALLLAAAPVLAQSTPPVLNYQGSLTDNSPQQDPVDGVYQMIFRIYGSPLGDDLLWSEPWIGIQVVDGLFSVKLGTGGSPLNASLFGDNPSRWLEVEVDGEILTPRQFIASAAYAAQAERSADVDCVDCIDTVDIADGAIQQPDIAPGAVDGTAVAFNSLTASNLAGNSVGASEIAEDAVGSSEIAANAVGEAELAANSVGSSEIQAGAVGASEIDPSAVLNVSGLVVDGTVEVIGAVEESGCADGTVEQRFPGLSDSSANREMVGCSGNVVFLSRATVCAPGWHVCDRAEWQNNFGAVVPAHNYWVDENLLYDGSGSDTCSVHTTSGFPCGSSSMKVCRPGGCTWNNCTYGTSTSGYNYYYGGCSPSIAGAVCCKGEPQAKTWQFVETEGDNTTGSSLYNFIDGLSVGPDWWILAEKKINGTAPAQYCLSNALFYIELYRDTAVSGSVATDPGDEKYFRLNPADEFVRDDTGRPTYTGTNCGGRPYDLCLAWLHGGITMAVKPDETGWDELFQATSAPSTFRLRVAATRLSACGF